MKHFFQQLPLLLFLFAVCGCSVAVNSPAPEQQPQPASLPEQKKTVAKVTAPPAQTVTGSPEAVTPSPAVKPEPATLPEKQTPPVLPKAEKVPPPPPPPMPPKKPAMVPERRAHMTPEKFRRGRGLWQAFSRLSPKEQHELMKLQRKDPEKFLAIMQEKADLLYAKERARKKELADLAQKYRDTRDPAQQAAVKARLREKLLADFQQRLQDNRRDLESNRKRLKRMEEELKKREQKRDAIIDAMLKKYISAPSPEK